MGRLDNFKPRKLITGSPFISISPNNGVSLNKSALFRLDYPEYVRILINEDDKELAIQVCDESDPNKEAFIKPEKKESTQYVRWNNREFIKQLTDWASNEDFKTAGFKVPGEYLPEEKAFLFIFSKAVPLKESEDK